MIPADQSSDHRAQPHPPKEGKPRFQRQLSAKSRPSQTDHKKQVDHSNSITPRSSAVSSVFSTSSSALERTNSSCSSKSSLEGFGLSDDFAKSLPVVSKQDLSSKYDPLPPIQFNRTQVHGELKGSSRSAALSNSMGRRKADYHKGSGPPKPVIKPDSLVETDSGPSSAKRARPLYRKSATSTRTRSKDGETPEDNVSPWVQEEAPIKAQNCDSKKLKGQPLHLAFRLLDGERIEKDFSSTDTVGKVVAFLLSQCKMARRNNSRKYILCSHDFPPKEYHDLQTRLSDVGIQDRMLLYLTDK